MIKWSKIFRESPIDWLLEKTDPSVRYFTLRDLLGKQETDPDVIDAQRGISNSQIVQKIVRKQNPRGYWEKLESPYLPKYKSSYWTVMLLTRLGLGRENERMAKACEFLFRFQHDDGGFCSESTATALRAFERKNQRRNKFSSRNEFLSSLIFESQYSCLTGNMASALIRAGYANEPRVKKALRWLIGIQNSDGGWLCPHWRAHVKDKHGCFMGTICPMEAFSYVPSEYLTNEISKAISGGAEFLLTHHLFKADHHDYKVITPSWLKLSYPWFAGYNILRGLDVLTRLGYVNDARIDDAVEILLQKRQTPGNWILEDSPMGRMQANIGTKGRPSKWITLIALGILKRIGD